MMVLFTCYNPACKAGDTHKKQPCPHLQTVMVLNVGSRGSHRGQLHFYGKDGVRFFTQQKTITSNWKFSESASGLAMSMPVLG